MGSEVPEHIRYQLGKMEEAVSGLEAVLAPFLNKTTKEIEAQLEPLQRAELHLALAQTSTSLFHLFLKARGIDPEENAISKEKDRLRQYSRKVRKAVAEYELQQSKRTLEVDVAAMSRFISAAVPDLSAQQKEMLKEAGAAAGKRREAEDGGSEKKKRQKKGGEAQSDTAFAAFLEETLAPVRGGKSANS